MNLYYTLANILFAVLYSVGVPKYEADCHHTENANIGCSTVGEKCGLRQELQSLMDTGWLPTCLLWLMLVRTWAFV